MPKKIRKLHKKGMCSKFKLKRYERDPHALGHPKGESSLYEKVGQGGAQTIHKLHSKVLFCDVEIVETQTRNSKFRNSKESQRLRRIELGRNLKAKNEKKIRGREKRISKSFKKKYEHPTLFFSRAPCPW